MIGTMDNYVTLSWQTPASTGGNGVSVSQYNIQIQQYDGTTFSDAP